MRAPASVRLSLLLSLIALFLPGSLSRQAFAQWSGAARDTLTHDSFRDENTPQSLVVDTSNTLHVIWERANAGTGWRIFYAHGRAASWTPPVEVGDSSLASYNPALAVEHNTGIPVVAYQASYGLSDEIMVATDSASVWHRTRLTINGTRDLSPTIAVDGSNNTHVAWIGQDSSLSWKIFYAATIGGIWRVQLLSGSSLGGFGSGAAPFLAASPSGVAHIFYRGGDYPDYHIHYATNAHPGDSAWSYEIITTPNGADYTSAATIDAQGTLHLLASGNDGFGFPPHAYYLKKTSGGTWSTPELANPGGTGSGVSLVLDRFGKAHVTWDEVSGNIITGNLYYATNRTGAWSSSPVQTDAQTYNGVLVIDGTGRGHLVAYNGATFPTQEIIVFHSNGTLTGFDQEPPRPGAMVLHQNYPNPFNPGTRIDYRLAERSTIRVRVCDILGREVVSLTNGPEDAGEHSVYFDGSNLASGVYVYTLRSSSSVLSRRMLLLR